MKLINFNDGKEMVNRFAGSEKKKTVEYEGKIYLLKFPDPVREKGKNISYINNVISEYIGSKIYELTGVEVQKVVLGTYTEKSTKIVCGCEDFVPQGLNLFEYKHFCLADVEADTPNEMELDEVLQAVENNPMIKIKTEAKERFWDMFVIDAFIGNPDRHIGNWGFIGNEWEIISLAPVYDCGSCLFPTMEKKRMEELPAYELKNMAYNIYSCYRKNGKRIQMSQFIESMKEQDCNSAVKRIVPKINMEIIASMIDDIELLSNVEKSFYKAVLNYRYERILKPTLKRLLKKERTIELNKTKEMNPKL